MTLSQSFFYDGNTTPQTFVVPWHVFWESGIIDQVSTSVA